MAITQGYLLPNGLGITSTHIFGEPATKLHRLWGDLRKVFTDNFQGAIMRAGTQHDLSYCKQGRDESLRAYTRRFFKTRTTVTSISD